MSLTLRITSYQRLSPGQSAEFTVDQGDCSIGRGPDNDWVLADPEMVLSKHHCSIDYRDGDYYLTDTSTNGVYINQSTERLGRGQRVRLSHADTLLLGDYEIRVSLAQQAAGLGASAAVDPLFGEHTEQLDLQGWDGDRATDPFASNLVDPLATPSSDPLGLDIDQAADAGDWRRSGEFDHLPSEHAFFQAPSAAGSAPVPPQSAHAAPPPVAAEDGLIPDDWEDSLMFKPQALSSPEPAVTHKPAPAPPATVPEEDPFDFLEAATEPHTLTPDADADAPDPFADTLPDLPKETLFPPPPPSAIFQDSPPVVAAKLPSPPSTPPPASIGAQGDPLLQVFLRAAGLQQSDLPAGVSLEQMIEQFGKLYRQTAQGMMALLRARSSIKNEFRIERTMVGPVANNPLKVLPTVDEAMKAMLSRQDGVWMPADRAIQEGFDDIRAHELAMIAGMQAALGQLLERFDPATLEEELGEYSRLANLMAGGRKARYWDAFTRLYSKLAARAEDDFQDLFRKEFAAAYEEQLDKLRQH